MAGHGINGPGNCFRFPERAKRRKKRDKDRKVKNGKSSFSSNPKGSLN